MLLLKSALFLNIFLAVHSLDAISYFIKNKTVKSVEITNLNDSWIEYKYRFHYSNKRNLTNVQLKIGIIPAEGFKIFDCKMDNKSGEVAFSGYSVNIIEMLKEILKFRVQYVVLNSDISLTDVLNSKTVDMIICHPNYSTKTEHVLQLYDTINTKYVVIYKIGKMYKTSDIFILTFVGSLWLVFLAVLILLAVCLKISTSYYTELSKTTSKWNWVEITLWAIAAVCQQGLSHCPERFASRCIFFLGYVTSYLLYTGFAAGITSILVRQDLSTFDFKLIVKQNLKIYSFHCEGRQIFGKSINSVDKFSKLLDALESQDSVGVVPELYAQQYFAANFDLEIAEDYVVTPIPGITYDGGFLLHPNSQWKTSLNIALLTLHQSGLLKNLLERSLLPNLVPEVKSAYSSAGQEHVGSATYLFLTGILATILLLIIEFLMASYRNYRQRRRGSIIISK